MIALGDVVQIPATRQRAAIAPGCDDCGAPTAAPCDEACPSFLTADHERLLVEVDAWEDHQAQTYLERRSA